SFTDPGAADTHTCTVSWGDNTQSTGSVSERNHTCTAVHQYTTASPAGGYQITFRIADNGVPVGIGTASVTITVRSGSSSSAATPSTSTGGTSASPASSSSTSSSASTDSGPTRTLSASAGAARPTLVRARA